jgi:acyl-CoA dehydrogenase
VTEPTAGTDTTQITTAVAVRRPATSYVVNGQKVWTSRALHSDLMILLARTTPLDRGAKRAEGLSVFLIDVREAKGQWLTINPIRNMVNHETTELFFDNLEIPAEKPDRRRGQGLPLHP